MSGYNSPAAIFCWTLVAGFWLSCSARAPDKAQLEKTLAENRSFSGAPPTITHQVAELGREKCLECHLRGDAKTESGEEAQITPHPELIRCQQCHLEKNTTDLFEKNSFAGLRNPVEQQTTPHHPPGIPHILTLRENCLGCHGTNGAHAAIRTAHPERVRCVQCHLPSAPGAPGPRKNLKFAEQVGSEFGTWSL